MQGTCRARQAHLLLLSRPPFGMLLDVRLFWPLAVGFTVLPETWLPFASPPFCCAEAWAASSSASAHICL